MYVCMYVSLYYVHFSFIYLVPPSFSPIPTDSIAIENSSHVLTCTAVGDPIPAIQWIHDGMSFPNGNTLTFLSVHRSDTGYYTCVATNIAQSINITIYLNVYCKLIISTHLWMFDCTLFIVCENTML